MYKAGSYGYEQMVDFMIDMGARDFDKGLETACKFGYMSLARIMLKKGATPSINLFSMNCSKHHNLRQLFIDKIPNEMCNHCHRLVKDHKI